MQFFFVAYTPVSAYSSVDFVVTIASRAVGVVFNVGQAAFFGFFSHSSL